MDSDEPTITAQDVSELNRAAVDRTAAFARIGGAVLVTVGAITLVGWTWIAIRAQQQAAVGTIAFGGNSNQPGLDLVDRLTLFVSSLSLLLTSAFVGGLGLLMRLLADFAQARVGGSITGFKVGDSVAEMVEVELEPDT